MQSASVCLEFPVMVLLHGMAIRYPELFSAVAPLGSDGSTSLQIDDVPIWAFILLEIAQSEFANVSQR
jgi:hypothetical protein